MRTSQIYHLVKRDAILRNKFIGVFSADTYAYINEGFYIVNTDTSDLKGSHWVVYYVQNGITEFFDSCGKNGYYYGMEKGELFNNVVLQGSLPVCGYYCLYFCLLRCRGISMHSIVNNLKRPDSDIYVSKSVLKHFLTNNVKKGQCHSIDLDVNL
jgi:hypothetical protein